VVPGVERDSSRALFLSGTHHHIHKNRILKIKHILSYLAFSLLLHAQEPISDEATLIDPIIKPAPAEQVPQPSAPQLEVAPEDILSSKTVYRNGQKFTVQEITPVELDPLPPPPPPRQLTPEQEAAAAARRAAMGKFRSPMLSCTVYDGTHTHIRWTSQGKQPVEQFAAWSNVNFHYLNSIFRFKKNDTTYTLLFGIGDTDTIKMAKIHARHGKIYTPPAIPALPLDPTTEPTFIVTQGNPTASDLEAIEGLHELFKNNHAELITEYDRITTLQKQQAAELAANPPNPKPDIIIRHWTIEPKEATTEQPTPTEGGQAQ
jgi:hypothetical protein